MAITKTYYSYIVKLMTTRRYLNDVPTDLLAPFLRAATRLLTYQITRTVIKSINHFLDVLNDSSIRPLLKLELKCENSKMFVFPRIVDFTSSFHALLDRLGMVGLSLPPLESWLGMKTESDFLPSALPEWLMRAAHDKLAEILGNLLQPINAYVNNLYDQFEIVYSPETPVEIAIFLAGDHSFQDRLNKVEEFNRFISDINSLVNIDLLALTGEK